jgi:hypothetical protein
MIKVAQQIAPAVEWHWVKQSRYREEKREKVEQPDT